MVVHDVEEMAGTQPPYGGGTMVVQRVSRPSCPCPCLWCPSMAPMPTLPSVLQTPEEERSLLHADSNGYTNLPDVVQPSHSPTENSKGQSSPLKDAGSDVSELEQVHRVRRHLRVGRSAGLAGALW
jgi:misshapen/NIK-related kinase